jgi:hypothetical protein
LIDEKVLQPGQTGEIKLFLGINGKVGKQKISAVVKANTETKFYEISLRANILNK